MDFTAFLWLLDVARLDMDKVCGDRWQEAFGFLEEQP